MQDIALIVLSSIAIILLLLLTPTQWRARNAGTLLQIGWLLVGNIIFFINALVWRGSIASPSPGWCDICVRFQAALPAGLSAASLCINRRLAYIASSRIRGNSQRQKRVDLALDLGIGIGAPLLLSALQYISQPHRFDILEGYGCEMVAYWSLPYVLLYLIWPLIMSLVSAAFGCVSIYYFISKRLEFRNLLRSSRSGLDLSHFVRLLCIASTDIGIGTPVNILTVSRIAAALKPWISWRKVHFNWLFVGRYTVEQWGTSGPIADNVMLLRYMCAILAFLLFALIGVTEEAVGDYMKAALWLRTARFKRGHHASSSATGIRAPKLGSSVVRPPGSEWHQDLDKSLTADDIVDSDWTRGIQAQGQHGTTKAGIAVKVEREIV